MLAKLPPLKLAQLAFVGTILSASRLLAPLLILVAVKLHGRIVGSQASYRTDLDYYFVSLILALTPMVAGSILAVIVKRRIQEGRENKRWTEQETKQAREWLKSPSVKRNAKAVYILLLGCFLVSLFPLHGYRLPEYRLTLSLIALLSALPSTKDSLAQIRKSLSPDPPPYDPTNWARDYKPLRSEQWGRHYVADSNPNAVP